MQKDQLMLTAFYLTLIGPSGSVKLGKPEKKATAVKKEDKSGEKKVTKAKVAKVRIILTFFFPKIEEGDFATATIDSNI